MFVDGKNDLLGILSVYVNIEGMDYCADRKE